MAGDQAGGGTGPDVAPDMAAAGPELVTAAAKLREAVHRLAGLFPGEPRVTIDGRYDPDLFGQPGLGQPTGHRRYGWEYNLRLTAPPGAAEIARTAVVPSLVEDGWRATDRSSAAEVAYQFSRSGFNLGVHIARHGGGDVVIGGSTPPVPATD